MIPQKGEAANFQANSCEFSGTSAKSWYAGQAKPFKPGWSIVNISSEHLVIRFYDDVWNRSDEALAREIVTPDFTFRGSLGLTKQGPEGFIDYMRTVHAALAGYTCTIDDLFATEARAAARMTFAGKHQGEFFGFPPTGRQVTWSGAAFFTFSGGRINDLWVLGDIDAIKSQLANA